MRAPLPANEDARLAALEAQQILDSAPEASFDDIAKLAQIICGTSMALVSLVDRDRQWFKARVGLEVEETPRDHAICAHAINGDVTLIVPDTRLDPRFSDNPLVLGSPNIRFYAGVPLHVDADANVGTLCVLDQVPRTLDPAQLAALEALARRVEVEMRLRKDVLDAREGVVTQVESARHRARTPHESFDVRAAPVEALEEGHVVADRYRIVRSIGAGGMGTVYLAVDTEGGADARVAMKVIRGGAAPDREAIERFAREGRALRRLECGHIARFLDAGNLDDGAPFLVVEYLEGEDLASACGGSLGIGTAVDLLIQACTGVATAHDAGVVHRDLKPANLFLAKQADGTRRIKLLDFGISKLIVTDDSLPEDPLTVSARVLGSPRYMSPEQMLSSRDVDGSTDVWSLGIVLYELLTGEHPFGGESVTEVCANVFTKTPVPMRDRRPEVPVGLDEVVLRCLVNDKRERWPSVRALAAALAPFRG